MRSLLSLLVLAAAAAAGDLETENERLRNEIAALKASDPDAALRKAVQDYLLGPRPEEMPRSPLAVDYQGGITFRSADGCHLIRLNFLAQVGYFLARDDSEISNRGQSGFEVDMLRIRVSGHAWSDRLKFFLEAELASAARRFTDDADTISEAWLRYHRRDWEYIRFRGGRFRAAFTAPEQAADEALALVERGYVAEHFTVGRVDGIAILVENLFFWDRFQVEIDLHSGSERFDPDVPYEGHDKRGGVTGRIALTLIGDGLPETHLAFEGAPYIHPDPVVVLGAGINLEDSSVADAERVKTREATFDVTWRHRTRWAQLCLFFRRDVTTDDSDDWGVQFTCSTCVVPRRVEFGLRLGYIDYGPAVPALGNGLEATFGFTFYWLDERQRAVGHRLRVNLDLGYAENLVTHSRLLNWPESHIEGFLFRAQLTLVF